MKEKIVKILNELDKKIVERQDESRMVLLGVLSGEHTLILGSPGTAKSLMARTMCQLIEGGTYFEYLLTQFTTPDEIFGPISVQGLSEDRYERITENFLPKAYISFLDEIFKASSAILNTLLSLINERKFHNGNKIEDVPLVSLIGASNEKPQKDEQKSLDALYDRFLIRLIVRNIQNSDNFKNVVVDNCWKKEIEEKITIKEIKEVQSKADIVKVPEDIWNQILKIKEDLKQHEIIISDRRWQKIVRLLRVSAASNGRTDLDESDLLLLKFLLIDDEKQIHEITQIIKKALTEGTIPSDVVQKTLDEIGERDVEVVILDRDNNEIANKSMKYKNNFTDTVAKALKNALKEDLNKIEVSLLEMNKRRNKIEDNTNNNIWVKWVIITDFIKPIDEEISKLNELKDKVNTAVNSLDIAPKSVQKQETIKFSCSNCSKKNTVNIILEPDEIQEIKCPYCGRQHKMMSSGNLLREAPVPLNNRRGHLL